MSGSRFLSYSDFVDWFESAAGQLHMDGDLLRLGNRTCRLPLILRRLGLENLASLEDAIDDPGLYGIVLMQAGRASVAIAQADSIVRSKQIQKYMVRKSQGKAQLTYLQEKGKSRLGSRIRLRQSEEFFQEINQRMSAWDQEFDLKQVFLSCTPKLKGAFFLSADPAFLQKGDPRWKRIPFMLRPPGEIEMKRIHRLLCRAEWYVGEPPTA